MRQSYIFYIALAISLCAFPVTERAFGYDPYRLGENTIELLEKEVSRDEYILSAPMNIIRLRQTRKRFSKDVPAKADILKGLKRGNREKLADIISVLEKTLADEKAISEETRIGEPTRVRTRRKIKTNLPKKRKALEKFRKLSAQ